MTSLTKWLIKIVLLSTKLWNNRLFLLPRFVKKKFKKRSVNCKMFFCVFKCPKKPTKFCQDRISALASKKRSNQKIRTLYTINWWILSIDAFTLLFWFDLFLEARAEILMLVIWEIWRHQKDIFKLTDLQQWAQ